MRRLRTPLCEILEIDYPIILAGMGGVATPALTAAVTNAGGLGVLGAGGLTPEELNDQIAEIRSATSGPFGVDTLIPSGNPAKTTVESLMEEIPQAYFQAVKEIRSKYELPEMPLPSLQGWFSQELYAKQIEVILDNRIPVYAAALGNPAPFVPSLHEAGTKVLGLIGNVKNAVTVAEGGVDALVAQGYDAGGHTGKIGTFSLIPSVVEAVGHKTPVIAAGGMSSGASMVAAMALGAEAVWVGTRFLMAEEAGLPRGQQEGLIDLGSDDVVITRYRTGKPSRMPVTPFIEEFESRGLDPLPMPHMRFLSDMIFKAAESIERYDLSPSWAGQGVYALRERQTAAAIVSELMEQATIAMDRLESLTFENR